MGPLLTYGRYLSPEERSSFVDLRKILCYAGELNGLPSRPDGGSRGAIAGHARVRGAVWIAERDGDGGTWNDASALERLVPTFFCVQLVAVHERGKHAPILEQRRRLPKQGERGPVTR